MLRSLFASVLLALTSCACVAQKTPSTHEVHADGSITFRVTAPNAQKVELSLDNHLKPLAMAKETSGLWSVTTEPLPPEIYQYRFMIDGAPFSDPMNPQIHGNYGFNASMVTVPGQPPQPWEPSSAPHGLMTLHRFTTHVAKNLPQDQSAYIVYTPAGYDAHKKGGYPVLYLLHGYSDNELGWTATGRADFVLDNMIASGKAAPMVVVMPLGYGDWKFITDGWGVWQQPEKIDGNTTLFAQELETEIIPQVEQEYNIAHDRKHHAIAGLSMGGLETLTIGLTHPEQFAYVAGFSSAVQQRGFDQRFPQADGKKAAFQLLWVSVGVDDKLLEPNRDFVAWAKTRGYDVKAVETPGAHQWPVWRENLVAVLPMLFH